MHIKPIVLGMLSLFAASTAMMTRREWNKHFKGDAMTFDSDEAFKDAHKDVLTPTGTLRHGPRHGSYVLQLRGCDSACHRALAGSLGQGKYWMRNAEVVQVAATPVKMKEIASGPWSANVVDYFPVHPTLKFERFVSSRISQCSAEAQNIKLLVSVIPLPSAELAALMSALKNFPGDWSEDPVHPDRSNLITVKLPCKEALAALSALTELRQVEWVEELGDYVSSNRWARSLCQSGNGDSESIFLANITGVGQIIGLSDTGLDMESCYFKDESRPAPFDMLDLAHRKVVYYDTYIDNKEDTVTGHGTHVAGSAAGKTTLNFGTFSDFNGNAPNAKIAFFDIGDSTSAISIPSNIDTDLLQKLYDVGARVLTHSWGLQVVDGAGNYYPSRNSYTTHARAVDSFMLANPDALVLFSAGNYGDFRDGNTVASPSTNKNGVCVGASLNTNDAFKSYIGTEKATSVFNPNGVAFFSSEGPTNDNRMKPDILAPGFPVYSVAAHQDCGAKALQGTSMASPTAAGIAVLVREYFLTGFYPSGRRTLSDGFNPSGALLKAMLVQSGARMDRIVDDRGDSQTITEYPSNTQGYGKIIIGNVLNFGKAADEEFLSLFVRGGATPLDKYYVSFSNLGEEHKYSFKTGPSESQHPIRVTVVFSDVVPAVISNTANVNELSLVVTNLNTSTSYTPLSAGSSTSSNVLMVEILTPAANSTFSVTVTCLTALSSDQPYAIVMSGEVSRSDTLFNRTYTEVSFSQSEIGISRSLFTSIWIIVAACVLLIVALFTIHRENVLGEKKALRRQKRNSTMYKGI